MSSEDKREKCLTKLRGRFKTLNSSILSAVAEKNNFEVMVSTKILGLLTGELKQSTMPHQRMARINCSEKYVSIEEIENCIDDILNGFRVLVILRGLPGSGKSYLAKSIIEACYGKQFADSREHIHSTDNYFYLKTGRYDFNPDLLHTAHNWNQQNVSIRMREGYSPIIVDNTNTENWEMIPYIKSAVQNGYKVYVLPVCTTWSLNCAELARRNSHQVPKRKIEYMLMKYQMDVTVENLLKSFKTGTHYQNSPMMRNYPPLHSSSTVGSTDLSLLLPRSKKKVDRIGDRLDFNLADDESASHTLSSSPKQSSFSADIEKAFSRFEIRDSKEKSHGFNLAAMSNEWVFPSLTPQNDHSADFQGYKVKPTTSEVGTTSYMNDVKDASLPVLFGRNKDITDDSTPVTISRPGMLDKGCWTEDDLVPDRDEDMSRLIDIFPTVPPTYLRETYDDCSGNFDMVVDIFLADNKDYSHITSKTEKPEMPKTHEAQYEKYMSNSTSSESLDEIPEGTDVDSVSNSSEELFTQADVVSLLSPSTGAIKKSSTMAPRTKIMPNSHTSINEGSNGSLWETDSDSSAYESIEINLGYDLAKQLQKEFQDPNHKFPEGFQPVVVMPKYLAQQIYALYIESMYTQMENQQLVLDDLVREDEAFSRKLHEEVNGLATPPPTVGLKEIMNEQAAMKNSLKQLPELKTPEDLSNVLTKKKLVESFPTVDKNFVLELYNANGRNYQQTVDDLIASVGIGTNDGALRDPPISQTFLEELDEQQKESEVSQTEIKTAQEYREEAEGHLEKWKNMHQKAKEYFHKGQREVAQFYSQIAAQYTKNYEIANSKAISAFLVQNSSQLKTMDTLDLHYLYVKEALSTLDVFIDTKIEQMRSTKGKNTRKFCIITGRGKRSANGVSRIKPVVQKRLETRQIRYTQENPGLLRIFLKKTTPVTAELENH